MKHPLILYYSVRKKTESFTQADIRARFSASRDKFPLILCVTREANHSSGHVQNQIGHYYFGMISRKSKRKINTAVWRAPKNLLAYLSSPNFDFKNAMRQSGKSPVVHVDIYPQSLLNSVKKKHDKRKSYPSSKLLRHFERILSYRMLWKRIKLVIFSLEPSLFKGRGEKYHEERELFQKLIQKRYGKVDALSVPFFGQGSHQLGSLKYWGDNMKSLACGLKKSHPKQVRLINEIIQEYHTYIRHNPSGTH